jgi:hypothetical protein
MQATEALWVACISGSLSTHAARSAARPRGDQESAVIRVIRGEA